MVFGLFVLSAWVMGSSLDAEEGGKNDADHFVCLPQDKFLGDKVPFSGSLRTLRIKFRKAIDDETYKVS